MLSKAPGALPPEIEAAVFKVIGAAIEVHRQLGPGFLESIYHRAMCLELQDRAIAHESKKRVQILYKGTPLQRQQLDLIVEGTVIVELKALSQLEEIHVSQLVSYLRATGLRAGLLINFNHVVLKAGIRRVVL